MKVGLIGCGAVAEMYYAHALGALTVSGDVNVVALVDPIPARRAALARFFPGAAQLERLNDLLACGVELAIVASPPRFHAEQVVWLLERECHVFCEKPLAATVPEAEAIVATAQRTGRLLAVGLVRRFFPALQAIAEFCAQGSWGRLQTFEIQEGGPFDWPAATPSFFDPRQAGGGVLLDAGVHVLDTLLWWLGEPDGLEYADDCHGGLEATCQVTLEYREAGIRGTILLSRDRKVSNRSRFEFERATIVWRVREANRIEIRPRGSSYWLVSSLETETATGRLVADSYTQAFTRQILEAVRSVREGRLPRVSGNEGLCSMRLIERCYRARTALGIEFG
jgi:predicted dehydrogenase